jgi:hypothetical protein
LSLPGVDPATISILSAEKVNQIPAEFMTFVHSQSDVQDYGDLTMLTVRNDQHKFTIKSITRWLTRGSLEHEELEVENGADAIQGVQHTGRL